LLKYKYWYDGVLKTSILIRDEQIVGIVFRVKDPFNYYAFELSAKHKFKRVRRVINGES